MQNTLLEALCSERIVRLTVMRAPDKSIRYAQWTSLSRITSAIVES